MCRCTVNKGQGGTNLPRVVPVQARLEVEQPLNDHVHRLRLESLLRLSLRRVLVEAGLRHADWSVGIYFTNETRGKG